MYAIILVRKIKQLGHHLDLTDNYSKRLEWNKSGGGCILMSIVPGES